jgi:hypothetical protein
VKFDLCSFGGCAPEIEVFGGAPDKTQHLSSACQNFTELAQAAGPENIGAERPLSAFLGSVPVLSPARITLENNGKIRPTPDAEKQFSTATGGGDGPGTQPSLG